MESISAQTYNDHKLATVFLDAGDKYVVIFCHGYRSSSIGPNRFFVRAARQLAAQGISSLRFDQYGSGNSDGDFVDSSFDDWVATTTVIVQDYIKKGYKVALFGQSMGGATVIAVAAVTQVTVMVAWAPDPNVDVFTPTPNGIFEEGGQIVQARYWQEAHDFHVADKLRNVKAPSYIVQCSDDEFVSDENHQAISNNAQSHHHVEMFKGYTHSSWNYKQGTEIIDKSVAFIVSTFNKGATIQG